jgi:hypothetical protein
MAIISAGLGTEDYFDDEDYEKYRVQSIGPEILNILAALHNPEWRSCTHKNSSSQARNQRKAGRKL